MEKKVKLDPNKVEYDGNGFRIVIKDEIAFNEKIEALSKVLKSYDYTVLPMSNLDNEAYDKPCNHNMQQYTGFTQSYKFCTKCNHKEFI